MRDNDAKGIPYIPILPKPRAKVIFIGRDPSPRTAQMVGMRGGKSAFINGIFKIADQASVPEDSIYITDICKCHWRTSVGEPLPQTEDRPPKLNIGIANTCMNHWLVHEIEILRPRLIIAFGEEVYQLLRPLVVNPTIPPAKFSAKADKSILDAEYWFAHNGTLTVRFDSLEWPLAVLRHPGNSGRLPKRDSRTDRRWHYHQQATQQVIALLKETCA
jgi:uracil-DNA glycosylase